MKTQVSTSDLAASLVSLSGQLIRVVGAKTQVAMSTTQARVLARLRDDGPQRVTELARAERCTQPSMTTLVDRLARAGWAAKRADDADGRAVLVGITDEGLRQVAATKAAMAKVFEPHLEQLDATQLEQLTSYTELLQRMMEDLDN
ncbi:MAG: MarR family transcriptional regulator [Streptosporangiales bacterium]|nr:MarR family transcriptional regulator [Streptosporangiales bacterium]